MLLLLPALALAAPEIPLPPEAPAIVEAPDTPAAPVEVRRMPQFKINGEAVFDEPSDDVFGMSGHAVIEHAVSDNAFLLAGDADIDAPVQGDLYVTGGEITISAPIQGDVYAMGGQITLTQTGSVEGHLLAWGGQVEVHGPVGGNLRTGAGRVVLTAPIGGDVEVEAGELEIASGALIGGDLDYQTPDEVGDLSVVVGGDVTWTRTAPEAAPSAIDIDLDEAESGGSSLVWQAAWWSVFRGWGYATKLAVGLVLLGLGGATTGRVARKVVEHPAQSLGLGFVTLAVLPVASTLAVLTVLPFPLGLLGFTLLGVALYVGQLFAAQALGDVILKRFRPDAWGSPVLSLAIGLVPLVLLTSLPWVGTLVWLAATLFGVGAVWLRMREMATA